MRTSKWMAGIVLVTATAVQAADFAEVEVSAVIARRSNVQNDDEKKAAHLEGLASATTDGANLVLTENDANDDGFIELSQNNPGKSKNDPVAGNGKMYIRETTLTLVNNHYEGFSVAVLDLDGSGPGPDDDGMGGETDANMDGADDDDQVVFVTLKVGERSNNHGPFLHGTFHDSLGKDADGDGQDDNGSIGSDPDTGEPIAAEALDQPKIKGQVRTGRNGK